MEAAYASLGIRAALSREVDAPSATLELAAIISLLAPPASPREFPPPPRPPPALVAALAADISLAFHALANATSSAHVAACASLGASVMPSRGEGGLYRRGARTEWLAVQRGSLAKLRRRERSEAASRRALWGDADDAETEAAAAAEAEAEARGSSGTEAADPPGPTQGPAPLVTGAWREDITSVRRHG